ncbi:MAG: TerC/Alx family metal homeostasis membrane protein [Chthoniobacterales bacterium]|nr:TerC/Alx family metal homeostasis membrane protein [Chthoniobacterales bacterium]
MDTNLMLWGGFFLFVLLMLALDFITAHRKPHVIDTREAFILYGFWTGLALLFNAGIFLFHERGTDAGLEFFTGFLVEKSLSIDNVFVFVLIFNYFRVPAVFQHKILFLGIFGAIVLRAAFILGGLALLERFHWLMYVFGALLVFTGISMMRNKDTETDPEKNWVIRLFRSWFPVSKEYDEGRFFTRRWGALAATPLFVALLAIESSDIVFAVDSIPAIFAISRDPFIVFTSNIFAMLGLRSLYFAVSGVMRMFHALHYGFASIILILGVKMLVSDYYEVPVAASLILILVILLVCIIVSLLLPREEELKMHFERPEKLGLMPFRRLLLIENVVDMAEITVRDSMRRCSGVRHLRLDWPWSYNLAAIHESRYSRYPLLAKEHSKPLGVILLKDLALRHGWPELRSSELREFVRPALELPEDMPLDDALSKFQRGNQHMAFVTGADGAWTGIITLEDVLEELVGKISDESDTDRTGKTISLADAVTPGRIVLDVQAPNLEEAIEKIVTAVPLDQLPADGRKIITQVLQREAAMTTYLGHGLAIPHCRLDSIDAPVLIFARSEEGIPVPGSNERIHMVFLLITPQSVARIQPRFLADIVGLVDSEYVTDRLKQASDPEEVIEAIRDGLQVVLD